MKRKRLLLLLALLMTAATGAWAQTSDKATPLTLQATADGKIYIYNPKDGMQYKVGDGAKQMVTGTDNVAINVTEGQTVQFFGLRTAIEAYGVEAYADEYGTYFKSSVPCYIYGNIMSLVDELYFATATVLSRPNAFRGLFYDFSNLLNHPTRKLVLPATTLTKSCYNGMFEFCTSLTTAPELPAPTLAEYCYRGMFCGCTSLNAVTCLATDISAQGATDYWLGDVAATGTLTIAKGMKDKWAAKSTDDGIPSGWSTDVYGFKVKLADGTADAGNWTATVGTNSNAQALPVGKLSKGNAVTLTYGGHLKVKSVTATTDAKPDPMLAVPMTIEAITAGSISVANPKAGMQYSLDGGATKNAVTTDAIVVAAGDKVQFYGNGTNITCYGSAYMSDDCTMINGRGYGFTCKVYGNIMSLVDEKNFATATTLSDTYNFSYLFADNSTLTDASGLLLPATQLQEGCYQQMFYECTALTAAPALPATQLQESCYRQMFEGCSALTAAPVLPAAKLVSSCYSMMFNYCLKLATVTCLATSGINQGSSTSYWLNNAGLQFEGTKTVNTFSTANWPEGDNGIPTGWTRVDIDN